MRELMILALCAACGGQSATKPDTKQANTDKPTTGDTPATDTDADGGGAQASADPNAPKADPCTGFEIDLDTVLMNNACVVPNPKPEDKSVDLKGKLDVIVLSSPSTVAPGGHADLTLKLTNKSNAPIQLSFTLDPTPRFVTETYNKQKQRVDMPPGKPPPLPKGMPAREPTSQETARITIVPNGTAKTTIPWNAVKMRWAPEKLKGSSPENGYPRVPAGNLAPGFYTVRVLMPLVLVFEGTDREVSGPKTVITVK